MVLSFNLQRTMETHGKPLVVTSTVMVSIGTIRVTCLPTLEEKTTLHGLAQHAPTAGKTLDLIWNRFQQMNVTWSVLELLLQVTVTIHHQIRILLDKF